MRMALDSASRVFEALHDAGFDPQLVVDVVQPAKHASRLDRADLFKPGPGVELPVPVEKLRFPWSDES